MVESPVEIDAGVAAYRGESEEMMRREEFLSRDPGLLAELAAHCPEGYLALAAAGAPPRAVPVNFALRETDIYFHGALAGDKFDRIRADGRVGFTIARPYSLVPSHWTSEGGSACPATQLYASIEVRGSCVLVDDAAEKALGLQTLMEKYQPEGGYRPLRATDSGYEAPVRSTGVFRLAIEDWTGKVRLAQERSVEQRERLVRQLRARGAPLDLITADRIAHTLGPA